MSYPDVDSAPRISIVIPTLNEARDIGQALQCIADNSLYKYEAEVLIVDGGSLDETTQIAKAFSDRLQIKIIDAPGSSVYRALNIALNAAQGVYFVRVDARSAIPPDYIKTCINHLNRPSIQCAGGIQLQYGDSSISRAIARVTASKIGTGGARFRTAKSSGFVDSVYLGVYRTETLRALGGFEDGSDYVSEDALVNKRIRTQGGRVWLDASLKVRYPAKATFRALGKQYVIYGAAKAFLVRKYHRLTSIRQVLPLLFFVAWPVLIFLCLMGWLSWAVFGAAFGAYLLLVVLSNFVDFGIDDQPPGPLWARCLAAMCIHFAWPIGFFLFLINPPLHRRLVFWL